MKKDELNEKMHGKIYQKLSKTLKNVDNRVKEVTNYFITKILYFIIILIL